MARKCKPIHIFGENAVYAPPPDETEVFNVKNLLYNFTIFFFLQFIYSHEVFNITYVNPEDGSKFQRM